MTADSRRRMLWAGVVGGGVLIGLSFLVRERGGFWLGALTGVALVVVLRFATSARRQDSDS